MRGRDWPTWMINGFISIKGKAKEFLGVHLAGKNALIVAGAAERRIGGEMKNGTIVLLSECSILPSFKQEEDIEEFDAPEPYGKISGPFACFVGDYAERRKPRGKILIKK